MKIFDMHTHAMGATPDPEALLSRMKEAGIYGGCIFSSAPEENKLPWSRPFSERLDEVISACRGYGDRLFPVLWIHPDEENIIEKVRLAKSLGVVAFKMICTDYFVFEDSCLSLLREIAALGLPVFFHSGILWDGRVSSEYNRPLNWEALLEIEGLRFSMGHCAWPWIDECIALYGKFLNTARGAEMFFDITPGTPEIYREELLRKLYTLGYDVGDNIMFGTDCTADEYRTEWAAGWLKTDKKILDSLGVSLACREKLYEKNLMRFLGLSGTSAKKNKPTTDDSAAWSCLAETAPIIEKWYKRLGFPECLDAQFNRALREIHVSDAITIEDYDLASEDGRRNLLSFLYMCEETERKYKELKIPEEILLDTLADLVVWTKEWTAVKGELYLGELAWLKRHLTLGLFRLGRLQFSLTGSETDIPEYGVKKGDTVLEIHIPKGGRLDAESCHESMLAAVEFYEKYFRDKSYSYLTCHSWLLDAALEKYLPEGSNILAFAARFKAVREDDSLALLRYMFRWDTSIVTLPYLYPASTLAAKIQRAALSGEMFHETLGVIEKSDIRK